MVAIRRIGCLVVAGWCCATMSWGQVSSTDTIAGTNYRMEDIIHDVYEQLVEVGETDYEELQEELIGWATNPIDINSATAADLEQLRFLSPTQVDAILLYVHEHPMQSVNELELIRELQPYEIRNLRPFVTALPVGSVPAKLYAKEVFHYAKHDIQTRVDGRNLEEYEGDPVYGQVRYQFNYQNRVQLGVNLRRYPGEPLRAMQYGGYVQLNDFGVFQSVVAGNYQAQFGQGLVMSNPYHQGKSAYVTQVGMQREGLRKYTNVDGEGLHGVGTSLQFAPSVGKAQPLYIRPSVFYSLTNTNDSLRRHTLGANLSFQYDRLKVGATFVEHLYSDSMRYYTNAAYNRHYFRGQYQSVVGANFSYQWQWLDVFGEVAAAENERWGVGLEVGSRFTPVQNVGLIVLYRYYSPYFDNATGYAFSETSRVNDENGVYVGAEVKRLRYWRFTAYGDVFRFDGAKYGIPYSPSWGYDAQGEAQWIRQAWNMGWRFRAREKAKKSTYALRYQFNWEQGGWKLRTQADGNIVVDSTRHCTWGASVYQDVQYHFACPLTLQFRAQAFDARQWDNRIYTHENDVLYAHSSIATYGCGGHFYLNLRWQIIRQLALYFKVSETVYEKTWAQEHKHAPTRTDIHLLLRCVL